MTEESQRKMHRSPNHPFFDLADAVARVKVIYEKEKRSATSPEVIVKHLGYGALNGPGGRTLSGLRQYGLLEEAGGRYKISDIAYALTQYSKESEQWKAAVQRAALTPTLYRDLYAMFPDLSASDETLRVTMLDKGFNPEVIERVVGSFRSTMQFAGLPDGSYTDPEDQSKMQIPPTPLPAISLTQELPAGFQATGNRIYAMAFEGDGKAVLTLSGAYTEEDLDDLKSYLETTLKTLKRSVKKEAIQ